MVSNIALTKRMVEYAKKHKLTIPKVSLHSNIWGSGKRLLAWRVSSHAFGVNMAAAQRTTRLEKLLFPPVNPKPHIIDPGYKWSAPMTPVGKHPGIVWHHAAGTGSPEDIHRIHLNIGDRGIAYHFYVRKDGTIYSGRPLGSWGAHCLGHNDWIGICAEGNYEALGFMPAAQKKSLTALHAWLHKKYDGIPDKKHKDMPGNATACPGKNYPFYAITKN